LTPIEELGAGLKTTTAPMLGWDDHYDPYLIRVFGKPRSLASRWIKLIVFWSTWTDKRSKYKPQKPRMDFIER